MTHVALPALNLIELCAGTGMLGLGLKLGLDRLGIRARTVCYVERESYAAASLVARMEDSAMDRAPVWDCVESFNGRAWRGAVDCVVAGIPCQGHSLAGKRMLLADERNLWPDTRRILRDAGARLFLLENVRSLLIPNKKLGLEAGIRRVLDELAEDGWDAEWCLFPASGVGASHRRERVFLLARHRDQRRGRGADEPRDEAREPDAAWRGLELAIAAGGGLGKLRQPSGGDGLTGGRDEALADTASVGLQGQRPRMVEVATAQIRPGLPGRACGVLPLFAPARDDYHGWLRVLGADPTLVPAVRRRERGRVPSHHEDAESIIRRVSDGVAQGLDADCIPSRSDRLRLCGNGVVGLQAAVAVVILWRRLFGDCQ